MLGLKKYRERGMLSKEVILMRDEGLEMVMMVSVCLRRVEVVIIDEDKNKNKRFY